MKCPFLKAQVIFPYKDLWYEYCSIAYGPNVQRPVEEEWKKQYCYADAKNGYEQCPIWQREAGNRACIVAG